MVEINRRKFLKGCIEGGVLGLFVTNVVLGVRSIKIKPGLIVDTTIKNIPFKLHGIFHCREFAEKYHDSLDDLVKNASVVVSEGNPESVAKSCDSGSSYFRTIGNLCKKYDKPLVYLDPQSSPAFLVEWISGAFGGVLMLQNAPKLIDENSTRRKIIKYSLTTAAGFYLCMSSPLYSLGLKRLVDKDWAQKEKYYYNHIVDQRNVEIANRLLKLPDMLRQEDLSKGNYVLVDYGRAHIPGIIHYLKSPVMRRVKTVMYALTYDLIDSEEMVIYRPRAFVRETLK